jgi:hypothetical protein
METTITNGCCCLGSLDSQRTSILMTIGDIQGSLKGLFTFEIRLQSLGPGLHYKNIYHCVMVKLKVFLQVRQVKLVTTVAVIVVHLDGNALNYAFVNVSLVCGNLTYKGS